MTHFSLNPGMVEGNLFNRRADGFSGKWKYTVSLDMRDFWDAGPTCIDAVRAAWLTGKAEGVTSALWEKGLPGPDGYWLVVTEPYHQHGHPVMIAV